MMDALVFDDFLDLGLKQQLVYQHFWKQKAVLNVLQRNRGRNSLTSLKTNVLVFHRWPGRMAIAKL